MDNASFKPGSNRAAFVYSTKRWELMASWLVMGIRVVSPMSGGGAT
ncbi:MAG: hypothetical protein GY820_27680 [Gammaproteobacteria bacterium]|nr:hypothetical protein [Gammaproteobacteria bacterium]